MIINKTNLHLGMCITLAIGIALAYLLARQELVFLVVILTCFLIITSKVETKLFYLFFFIPWLQVLKSNPSDPSFFNLYVVLFIISTFVLFFTTKKRIIKLPGLFLLFLSFYCIFSSILSTSFGLGDLLRYIAGFTIPFIFIHYYKPRMFKSFVYAYSLGIISSSILGLFRNQIPMLTTFTKVQYIYVDAYIANRFTGLAGDSNAFSIPVLIAISLLLVLNYYKPSLTNYLLLIVLTILGLLTISKMFLASFCVMIILYLFFLFRSNLMQAIRSSSAFIASAVIGSFFGLNFLLNNYLYRLNSLAKYNISELDSITNGRYSIWEMYLNEIISNTKIFFWGEGLSASLLNGWQAHNTYIEMWFKIGIIGILLFTVYLVMTYKYIKKCKAVGKIPFLNFIPLIVLLLSSFSLNNFGTALIMQLLLVITAIKYGKWDEEIELKITPDPFSKTNLS